MKNKQEINIHNKIIIITGPTASGKTAAAIKLAQNLSNPLIINADAAQVYIETPIISAQPTEEEKNNIPHILYGYIKGENGYSVRQWLNDVYDVITKNQQHSFIIVGGSGMYINSMINGIADIPDIKSEVLSFFRNMLNELGVQELFKLLKEKDIISYNILKPNDKQRILRALCVVESTGHPIHYWQQTNNYHLFKNCDFIKYLKSFDRNNLYKNINHRFDKMMDSGAFEEIIQLYNLNLPDHLPILKSHGVPEIFLLLKGLISREEAFNRAKQNIRNYAKRQITWYKNQYKYHYTI